MAQDNSNSNAGAAAAGAAITAMGNYAVNVANNKRQWRYQQRAMQLQHQYNREVWDYQNAYNTPQAQMERLQAAGLNPRLIYGGGGQGFNTAGPMPTLDVPTREVPRGEIPDMMGKYISTRQADAQYAATNQNLEIMRKRAALMDVEQGLQNLKLFRENLRSKNYKDLAAAELDTQKFIALRSGELYANEKTKGNLMDQLGEMRQKQITSIDLDNAFKANRNELAKLGIYAHDHPAMRILMQASNRMGIDFDDLIKEGASKLKYLLDLAN